eukprot:CAMPEP_0170482570 /NCGR_PEP_ID=MMETSP0208-20121228/2531_1 /TAXON_ID=197538 /ORGANISM="Strombidium inclinatum, Strain S3" /LENGTH=224 /DNA_ID=CAMNT_0010755421 /DNA_START=1815 /DNA_END=2486 /DNA_ORIENTATION=+
MRLSEGVPSETKFFENSINFKYVVTTGFRRDGVGIIRLGLLLGFAICWLSTDKSLLGLPALFIGYLVTYGKIDEVTMVKKLLSDIGSMPVFYQVIGVVAPLLIAILFKLINDFLVAGGQRELGSSKPALARIVRVLRISLSVLTFALCAINMYLGAQSYGRMNQVIPDMGGEKFFLLDLAAIAIIALKRKMGSKSSSMVNKVYFSLVLFALIWNLDTILSLEVW